MIEFTGICDSQCVHQSEGFARTGYFVPACVGIWAWPGQKNCRRAVVVAVVAVGVAVIFLNARLSKEKIHKIRFCKEFKR